jgi:glycosyltransferase involved in cell wall biosynthesis
LICGESFWHTLDSTSWSTKLKQFLFNAAKSIFLKKQDDERSYNPLELIEKLGIADRCVVFNSFIPNEDVHRYFQSADAAVLFYLTATPSGIESLSYNFKLPLLATSVGHFPETIRDGFNGYLAKPEDIEDMAKQMMRFLEHPIDRSNVAAATANMSWSNYAQAILKT